MKGFKPFLLGSVCLVMLMWTSTASAQLEVQIHTDFYTPLYYLDYPVFYDDAGVPFYYVNGVVTYVPPTYANYRMLRRHYRAHRRHYRRWYRERGHRHHGYRRVVYSPLYHDGYTVYYDDVGEPYYWVGSRRAYIPRHHPRYRVYHEHYGRRYSRRSGPPSGRPHRVAEPRRRGPAGYGGRVDCRRNPGHPACARGGPRGGVRHVGPRPGGPRPGGPRHGGPRHHDRRGRRR
jgi:hypothetical protein